MSHPEFFSGISRPCCLFSKRESRGRQPFGGVWGVPKISFSSLTRSLWLRVRGKKGLGGTAPNPPSLAGYRPFQAPQKFGMTHSINPLVNRRNYIISLRHDKLYVN